MPEKLTDFQPAPEGHVAEWRQWEHRINEKGESVGVYEPNTEAGVPRVLHPIKHGEELEIERRGGDYEVRIVDGKTRKPVRTLRSFSHHGVESATSKPTIDSARLNTLMIAAEKPSALFGEKKVGDINLTQEDRVALAIVMQLAEQLIGGLKQGKNWQDFQRKEKELRKIQTLPLEDDIFNGGPSQKSVEVRLLSGSTELKQIVLPESTFGLFKLGESIAEMKRVSDGDNQNLRGTKAEYFGKSMRHIASFLKQNKAI